MKDEKVKGSARLVVLCTAGVIVLIVLSAMLWFSEDRVVEESTANAAPTETTAFPGQHHASGGREEAVKGEVSTVLAIEDNEAEVQIQGFQRLREAFQSRAPIGPVLTDISIEQDWTKDKLLETAKLWRKQCRYAENVADRLETGRLEGDDLSAKHEKLMGLAESCKGFEAQFGESIAELEEREIESWDEKLDHNRLVAELHEAPERFGDEYALKSAMDLLDRALVAGDEWMVLEVVWALIHNGLVDPPLDDMYYNQLLLSLGPVPWDVTAALMCRQIGGCTGNHPIVLRQCLIEVRICHEPEDIYDVIVQVHTGMQQLAFWTVYDQITQHLARYRARNR